MIEYQGTKEVWNTFVAAKAEDGGVLQSWEWGEFQKSLGRKIYRFTWGEQKIEGTCLLVEHQLPFALKYMYAPRGPVVTQERMNERTEEFFLDELKEFAHEQGSIFLRFEPPHQKLRVTGYELLVTKPIQPAQTLRIDLTKSTETLLSEMHEKTRYNARLAIKHGVQVENFQYPIPNSQFESFWNLMQETAKRDGFTLHSKEHYKQLMSTNDCLMFNAQWNNQTLAAALVAFFGNTAYYLHGASTSAHRDVMAPYALQWAIMQEARQRGCTVYDFWGTDAERWSGVTRFKKGFAPQTSFTQYPGTFDVPIRKPLYMLYRLWKSFH